MHKGCSHRWFTTEIHKAWLSMYDISMRKVNHIHVYSINTVMCLTLIFFLICSKYAVKCSLVDLFRINESCRRDSVESKSISVVFVSNICEHFSFFSIINAPVWLQWQRFLKCLGAQWGPSSWQSKKGRTHWGQGGREAGNSPHFLRQDTVLL